MSVVFVPTEYVRISVPRNDPAIRTEASGQFYLIDFTSLAVTIGSEIRQLDHKPQRFGRHGVEEREKRSAKPQQRSPSQINIKPKLLTRHIKHQITTIVVSAL